MSRDFYRRALELQQSGSPFVVVTVVDAIGSVPQDQGAHMLVQDGAIVYGTVGGGKVEQAALKQALSMLENNGGPRRHFVTWSLERDIGMTCGGSVRFYFEVVDAGHWHIVIFGAGHCASALVSVLAPLDCQVTVVDTRPAWLDRIPPRPGLERIQVGEYREYLNRVKASDYVLLMTMGHSTDSPLLVELMQGVGPELPYLGVIGSKAKAARLKADLLAASVHPATADKFLCPVGLSVGGNDPPEIAISIAAQLLERRDARVE